MKKFTELNDEFRNYLGENPNVTLYDALNSDQYNLIDHDSELIKYLMKKGTILVKTPNGLVAVRACNESYQMHNDSGNRLVIKFNKYDIK